MLLARGCPGCATRFDRGASHVLALTPELRLRVVSSLINGNSISSTVKMTGVAKTTILRLVVKLGLACRRMHAALVRDLRSHFIELDEQWSFVGLKEKRKTESTPTSGGRVRVHGALSDVAPRHRLRRW